MKKFIFFGIIFSIIFISSCSSWEGREYSFTDGFFELSKLDAKYDTSFHEEKLNASMIALENVEPFIADLEEFRENVRKTKDSLDKEALIDFIATRITMVLAQKNFQLAQNIGDIGLSSDEAGFKCSDSPYIFEASNYYNKSLSYTQKARRDLDTILYKYRKVPNLQGSIGLGLNKTEFYYFHLGNVNTILESNNRVLKEICKVRVVKN